MQFLASDIRGSYADLHCWVLQASSAAAWCWCPAGLPHFVMAVPILISLEHSACPTDDDSSACSV